jgi:hypothetical protein
LRSISASLSIDFLKAASAASTALQLYSTAINKEPRAFYTSMRIEALDAQAAFASALASSSNPI